MDLRRSLVEKKLSSRKNKSKNASRNASNHGTDDEYETDDNFSVTSYDSLDSFNELSHEQSWSQVLSDTIDALVEKRNSSSHGREESLSRLCQQMTSKVAREYFGDKEADLALALCKISKAARSEKETILCVRALAVLYLTCPDTDAIYSAAKPVLLLIVQDSSFLGAKACALTCIATFDLVFNDRAEAQSTIDFLVEIIENDGNSIDAPDAGTVVAAAIDALAVVLSTLARDFSTDEAQLVTACLVDQLESVDNQVRTSAGEAIALVFEMTGVDPDDEAAVATYTLNPPFHDIHHLVQKLSSLATTSSKRQSKESRREQHSSFREILATVSSPTCHAAPTETVKFGRSTKLHNTLYVTTWRQIVRLYHLRRVLGSGMLVHLKKNPVVRRALEYEGPLVDSDAESDAEADDMSKDLRTSINQEIRRQRNKDRAGERKEKSSMHSSFIADEE